LLSSPIDNCVSCCCICWHLLISTVWGVTHPVHRVPGLVIIPVNNQIKKTTEKPLISQWKTRSKKFKTLWVAWIEGFWGLFELFEGVKPELFPNRIFSLVWSSRRTIMAYH
jgi:hypothetical protein